MRYARPTKHYRAAEQEARAHSLNGVFVPDEEKPKLAVCAAALSVLVFLLGLLVGAAAGRD